MDQHDLLKLLDLNAKPPPSAVVTTIAAAESTPSAATNPTALRVDEWGLRRGRDLVAESERLRKAGTDEFAAADFFAAAFDPDPQLLEDCADTRRREFLAQLLDTPEYRSLHAATRLDDVSAGIAAAHFAEQFATLKQEEEKAATEGAGGTPAAGDDLAREMAALRAVGRAVAEAGKEVNDLKETAAALGLGPGEPGANDPTAIAALFKRVRSDRALREICDLAGRFRRVAQSKQRQKAAHGLDEVIGVEPGGDLGRVLPAELVKLVVPELELDTLRRLVERQLQCRELRSVEPVGKGPIIVVVDESGSMEGERVHTAKALALALAWIARRQRRWCGLVAYSGDSGERLLALPPSRWDESALCDWLSAFIGRGSSLDLPIREMPDYYQRLGAPAGITDLIFVTDAQARIPDELRIQFSNWKKSAQVRVISLVLDNPPGDLAAVSDEVHTVQSLDPGGDAVGRVLSI